VAGADTRRGQGANAAIPAAFIEIRENDETEADHLGVQYMYAPGMTPRRRFDLRENRIAE